MAVKLFLQILKAESIFRKYPLCITMSDIVIDSDGFNTDNIMIKCYDFVEPSDLALGVIRNVESPIIVNVDGEELISDCYNSVVNVKKNYINKDTLVSVMRNYLIKHRFNCRTTRSDKQSYVLLCKSSECSWAFKASCKHGTDTFIVRTFNDEHTCSIMDIVLEQQHATIAFIAGITAPKLVNYKKIITPSDIIEDIKRELGLDIDYMKAWRGKECALKILRGRPADGYKKMPTYVYIFNSIYTNSHIRMHKSPDNQFMYLFIALQPLIKGFGYCSPVVVVDGHILLLAYGVVDSENDLSWMWFFQQFKCAFGERDNVCVVSDRHESIIKEIRESTNYIYGVYEEGRKYIVRLDIRTYNCGRFQLDEIPCRHVIAVLKRKHVKKIKPYCSDYYKKEALVKTYEMLLCPIPDK
ncbi:uncharacterized protein LOC107876520 [Capsicum annuum]|uniref:uncharacterized protein LOC107876520 n=1 Tax=Capsicum annuum TaxID=4072 RepID=UPI0007BEF29F|nr:uncharacterized protein LOC107876520 [Capsicum annuum]